MFLFLRNISSFLIVAASVPRVSAKGFDHTVVMIRAFGLVPGNSQGRCCELERGVVRDVEAPIVVKTGRLRGRQVAISDGEEICDFLPARLVLLELPEFEPIP
jgi:hypothetical protein